MFTWLRFRGLSDSRSAKGQRRPVRRSGYKPRIEALEDRAMMAELTWTGAAGTAWSNPNNWNPAQKPDSGDDLVFPLNAANKTNTNDLLSGKNFNSINLTGSDYVLNGNRIDLRTFNEKVIVNFGTNTINLDINFGIGELFFSNRRLVVNSVLTINGVLDGGGLVELKKLGFGTLVLNAANTYAGETLVEEGIISVRNAAGLGKTSSLAPGNDADTEIVNRWVELQNNLTIAEDFELFQSVTTQDPALRNVSGNNTITGRVKINGNDSSRVEVSAGSKLTISGEVRDSGRDARIHGVLRKSGPGELVLSGSNTYTGPTLVQAGQVTLKNNNALGGLQSGTTVFGGAVLAGSGVRVITDSLNLNSGSELTALSGSNVTWNGAVELSPFGSRLRAIGNSVLKLTAPLTVSGDLAVTGGLVLNGVTPSFVGGTVTLAGATKLSTTPRLAIGGGATLKVTGGLTGTANLTIKADALPGGGAVILAGPGPYTHTGTINLNTGTLEVDATLASSEIITSAGTTLRGTGLIPKVNALAGTVNPGTNTPGRLRVGQNITLASAATLRTDLSGTVAGSTHDQLRVTGTVNLQNPTLSVKLNFTSAVGNSFRIIDNLGTDAIVGTFAGLPVDGSIFTVTGPGGRQQRFAINYHGGDGNDVVITHTNTPTMAPGIAITPAIQEGQVAHLRGHLVDPDAGDPLTLVVNWGDGSQPETFRPGLKDFDITHRYLDNPRGTTQYIVRTSWFDNHNGGNSRDLPITVTNVAPVLSDLDIRFAGNNQVFVTTRIVDPGQDSLKLVINWGDGQSSTFQYAQGTSQFPVNHRYQDPGDYRVSLSLTDDDGGQDFEAMIVHLASSVGGPLTRHLSL